MQKTLALLKLFFTLALLASIGWFIYTTVIRIGRGLAGMKSELTVAIIAASASITVSILSLIISKSLERRATVIQELRIKKIPVYEEFISTLYRVLFADKPGQQALNQEELVKFFADFTEKLTIWGSDDVIKAWRDLRMSTLADEASPQTLFCTRNCFGLFAKI